MDFMTSQVIVFAIICSILCVSVFMLSVSLLKVMVINKVNQDLILKIGNSFKEPIYSVEDANRIFIEVLTYIAAADFELKNNPYTKSSFKNSTLK